jgi:carboxyl-terminal processing protease
MHEASKGVSATALLRIDEEDKPRFSFRIAVDDSKGGNGDGLLQIGERVTLSVKVKNEGKGVATDALIAAKNLSHGLVYLDQGRGRFGELKSGAEGAAELAFSIREPSRRGRGDDTDHSQGKLRITVWDGVLGESVSEVLALPVAQPQKLKKERRSVRIQTKDGAPVFAGASVDMPVIGRAKNGLVLRSNAATAGWRRVELKGGVAGFVQENSLKVVKSGKATPAQVQMVPAMAAPEISIDVSELVTGSSSMRIAGDVVDRERVKDIFVFVNDKKVYYESFEDLEPKNGGVKASFDVSIPLEDGSNAVAVVARQSEDLLSRRVFGIYRNGADAVAERKQDRDAVAR